MRIELVTELFVLSLEELLAPKEIDRAMFGGGHEPCARIIGNAGDWPLFQRDHQGVLREIFRLADVSHHARETGDQLRGFDSPDSIDGSMRGGVRHGLQSDERTPRG